MYSYIRFPNSLYWEFTAPIAGVLLTLAFSPFDYSYAAIGALAVLFASWQGVAPNRAFLRGLLFGLGTFASGVSWVYISIHDMGNASLIQSTMLTVAFVSIWALFPALAGYCSVHLAVLTNALLVRLLVMSIVWVLIEFIRGSWLLNGFPWLLCAYSQLDTPLSGYVPLVGVYGAGFLLALTAAAVAAAFYSKKYIWLSIVVITLIWTVGVFLQTKQWTYPIGDPIRVALVQGNIAQDQKWRSEYKAQTLQLYKTMTEQHWDSGVIIWPETAIPAFLSQVNDSYLMPLSDQARQHHTDLIVSVPVKNEPENTRYNAVITLGGQQGIYKKRHLLPFGEYLPWRPLSGFVLNKINMKLGEFTPGEAVQPLLKAGGYSFNTSICYEDVFADSNAQDVVDAAYLVNVTNDAWFGHSIEPYQHMQIARMRALETGRYLLRATNTGLTGIVSPDGKIIAQAPLFQATVLTGEFIPMAGLTPFIRLGDNKIMYVLMFLLMAIIAVCLFVKNDMFHHKAATHSD
jgi:apolipoprotein N-acyltransferase